MLKKLLLLLLFSCQYLGLLARQSNDKEYILVLHSINLQEIWTSGVYQTIQNTFTGENLAVESEEFQIPVLETIEEVEVKRKALRSKYENPPRLVVCIGDPSWMIAQPLFDEKWKDVPVIICYSFDYIPKDIESLLNKDLEIGKTMIPSRDVFKKYNLTTIQQPVYVQETVSLMKKLLPGLKQLVFICDNRFVSILSYRQVEETIHEKYPELGVKKLSSCCLTTEQLLDSLSSFGRETGIVYYSWFVPKTSGENRYLVDNVQKMTNSFSNPPVFVISDLGIQTGNFSGGYYIPAERFSASVISTIREVLNGKAARDIPVQIGGEPATYLNYQHLQGHNVPEKLYPDNAIYFQKPPTFLQKYKIHILGVLIIIVLVLIVAVLRMRLFIQRQKEYEKEYAEAVKIEEFNQKYRLVLRASRIIAWSFDLQENSIYCEPEYLPGNSIPRTGLYILPLNVFVGMLHPDDKERVMEAYRRLVSEEIEIFSEEMRLLHPDESDVYFWVETFAVIGKRTKEGKAEALVGGTSVIDQRKKMEQELREKAKVEEANRLKSAFLANMSHEIRTPLNAIVGFSNLIVEMNHSEEAAEFRRIIETNNELLLQLINDILDLSKIEAGQMDFIYSDFDLSVVFRELEQVFRCRPKEGVLLSCSVPMASCVIHSERNRITQVITNFLTNACKFTFSGTIEMGYELTEDGIRCYVTDTGKGIPQEKLAYVFDRFAKFDSFIQGTGLGLSICDTIIRTLNGEIGVESEEGVGSTFWFTLPCPVLTPSE